MYYKAITLGRYVSKFYSINFAFINIGLSHIFSTMTMRKPIPQVSSLRVKTSASF